MLIPAKHIADAASQRSIGNCIQATIESSEAAPLLKEIGRTAENRSESAYIAGGFVRDLLIGQRDSHPDLDIVVEGDAIQFATVLGQTWNACVQAHARFGTAALKRTDGLRLDFVRARSETYTRPGALPSVKYGTIADDLRRRDFSINTLAMRLNPNVFGEIVDCTGALKDLRAGRIRTLHDRSFIDDPTRIFRAIRYEQRYRFRIVGQDVERIWSALEEGVLSLISGQRLRHEIDCMLLESAAARIIRRLLEFKLFCEIHPAWEVPSHVNVSWEAAVGAMNWASTHLKGEKVDAQAIRWMALLTGLSMAEAVSDRLVLENQMRTKLTAKEQLWRNANALAASTAPSEVYRFLQSYPLESLLFALAHPEQPRWRTEKIRNYLSDLRHIRPLITGSDLLQVGLKPGKRFTELLWKAFAAQLDGKILTKVDGYQFLGVLKAND